MADIGTSQDPTAWVAPPSGMSDSHPWREDDDPIRYATAREHLRAKLMAGDVDMYKWARSTMDDLLAKHSPDADRRPFIHLVDDFCSLASFQDQVIEQERASAQEAAKEVSYLRARIEADQSANNARVGIFKAELTASVTSRQQLIKRVESLEQELRTAVDDLKAERKARLDTSGQYAALRRLHDEHLIKAEKQSAQLTDSKAHNAELTSRLQRIKNKHGDTSEDLDKVQEELRDAERANRTYVKRILNINDTHEKEVRRLKDNHAADVARLEGWYRKMKDEYRKERDGLWEEILKLLPPEPTGFDPMQCGPRVLRREDLLRRRLRFTD